MKHTGRPGSTAPLAPARRGHCPPTPRPRLPARVAVAGERVARACGAALQPLERRVMFSTVQVDTTNVSQTVEAIGGNFAKGRFDGGGFVNDTTGIYNVANLDPRRARVGLPLKTWEPSNDNADPAAFNWGGFYAGANINNVFTLMQQFQQKGVPITASVWDAPPWMFSNPTAADHKTLLPNMIPELAESMAAFLVRARDTWGVTVDAVSINESDGGYSMLLSSSEMTTLVKTAGPLFARYGLTAKWVVGDTTTPNAVANYATPTLQDATARQYIKAISYHSWGVFNYADSVLTNIAAMGRQYNLPVWCEEVGYDSALYKTPATFPTWAYASKLAQTYYKVLKVSGASVADYWEYQNDYPLATSGSNPSPYPAFFVVKQYADNLKPGSQLVQADSDNSNVLAMAARDVANDKFFLQLINKGTSGREVQVNGLPATAVDWIRSSSSENAKKIATYNPTTGMITVTLPADSVNQFSGRLGVAAPWADGNVGTVTAGGSIQTGGTFAVKGAGSGAAGSSDGLRFVYTPTNGASSVAARVGSIATGTEAGLVLRESPTDPTSKYVGVFVSPAGAVTFRWRPGTGGAAATLASGTAPASSTASTGTSALTAVAAKLTASAGKATTTKLVKTAGGKLVVMTTAVPNATSAVAAAAPAYWLKLARSAGGVFTAYTSPDGATWTTLGATSLSMAAAASMGMTVSGTGSPSATPSATFDSVAALALPPGAGPRALSAAATAGGTVVLNWYDGSGNEDGFKVERSTDNVSFAALATVTGTNKQTYTDATVSASTKYYYRVRAYNAAGTSAPTVAAAALTPTGAYEAENAARSTGVVVSTATAGFTGSGYLDFTNSNQSVDWAVTAPLAGTYNLDVRYLNTSGSRPMTLTVDGVVVNAALAFPTNTTWGVLSPQVTLSAGAHSIKLAGSGAIPSDIDNLRLRPAVPTAPSGLTTASNSGNLTLSWADNSAVEDGFRIERSTDGLTWAQIGTAAANATTWVDATAVQNTSYFYQVRAYDFAGDSGYTDRAAGLLLVPPAAPAGLVATLTSGTQATLTWLDRATDETAYKLEVYGGAAGFVDVGLLPANTASYVVTGLTPGQSYSWRVRAYNTLSGDSPYSNAYTITTSPPGPTSVVADPFDYGSVWVSWDPGVGAASFFVERSDDGATGWTRVGYLNADAEETGILDNGLADGTTYYYRVTATAFTSLNSAPSAVASTTTYG